MVHQEDDLKTWFCNEILPLEPALMRFISKNWRQSSDHSDLRQSIYERVLKGAQKGIPFNPTQYLFTVARNHLINQARRANIVSIELVAELEDLKLDQDFEATHRQLEARDDLRRAQMALEALPNRCREVVSRRKILGMSTREVAEAMGISVHTVEKQMTLGMRKLATFMLGQSTASSSELAVLNAGEKKKK